MISGGRTQARDEVFTLIKATTDPLGHRVIWQDELEDLDVNEVIFAVTMRHFTGREKGMTQGLGQIRSEAQGAINILIRCPVRQGGLTLCDNLTKILEDALRGQATPNGVWFRDVIGREVPAKDGNVQTNVTAEFTYQEMT